MIIDQRTTGVYSICLIAPNGDVFDVPTPVYRIESVAKGERDRLAKAMVRPADQLLGQPEIVADAHEFAAERGCHITDCRLVVVSHEGRDGTLWGRDVAPSDSDLLAEYAGLLLSPM